MISTTLSIKVIVYSQTLRKWWAQFLQSTGEVYVDSVLESYTQVVMVDPNVDESFSLLVNLIAQFIEVL